MAEDEAPPLPSAKRKTARSKKKTRKGRKPKPPFDLAKFTNALSLLTQSGEYEKLMGYAYYRMRGIRGVVFDTDARDLLHEAIFRSWEGKRRWTPEKVSLFNHLLGAMRSIGNALAKKGAKFIPLVEWAVSPHDAHHELEVKTDIKRLRSRLRGDTLGLTVLETMLDGQKPKEARADLGLTPKHYDAARKRVIRHAKRLFGPEGGTL